MATTTKKVYFICSDCKEWLYGCDHCRKEFNRAGKEIICTEFHQSQKHFCFRCKDEGINEQKT